MQRQLWRRCWMDGQYKLLLLHVAVLKGALVEIIQSSLIGKKKIIQWTGSSWTNGQAFLHIHPVNRTLVVLHLKHTIIQ